MKTYKVILWGTGEVVAQYEKLADARKHARKLGYTKEETFSLKNFAPVAFIGNDNGLVYNPRFPRNTKGEAK